MRFLLGTLLTTCATVLCLAASTRGIGSPSASPGLASHEAGPSVPQKRPPFDWDLNELPPPPAVEAGPSTASRQELQRHRRPNPRLAELLATPATIRDEIDKMPIRYAPRTLDERGAVKLEWSVPGETCRPNYSTIAAHLTGAAHMSTSQRQCLGRLVHKTLLPKTPEGETKRAIETLIESRREQKDAWKLRMRRERDPAYVAMEKAWRRTSHLRRKARLEEQRRLQLEQPTREPTTSIGPSAQGGPSPAGPSIFGGAGSQSSASG